MADPGDGTGRPPVRNVVRSDRRAVPVVHFLFCGVPVLPTAKCRGRPQVMTIPAVMLSDNAEQGVQEACVRLEIVCGPWGKPSPATHRRYLHGTAARSCVGMKNSVSAQNGRGSSSGHRPVKSGLCHRQRLLTDATGEHMHGDVSGPVTAPRWRMKVREVLKPGRYSGVNE